MKLLTVISELGIGGAEVVAVRLAVAAAREGHEVCVASTPGFRVAELERAGVRHVPLQLVGRRPADLVRSLQRLRRIERPDLVHAHNPKPSALARVAFGPDVPIITTLHGVSAGETRRTARLVRWTSQRVAVVSPHLVPELTRHGYPADRIDVIPNSVDPLPVHPQQEARRELGIDPGAVVGLCLARMVDQKRHDLLLDAWASKSAPATLLLAGDGPLRPTITAQSAALGLGDEVRFLGAREDVPRLLAAADFVVLPTDWEGLPISVLEAMSSGVPVIASGVPGILDQFGTSVRVVEPGSAPALTAALDRLIADPSERAALGARGEALAADRFGSDRMITQYREVRTAMAAAEGQRCRVPQAG